MTYRVPAGRCFRDTAPVFVMLATLALLGAQPASAADPASKAGKKTATVAKVKKVAVEPPIKLTLEPSKFELSTPRCTLQLVATGTYASDRVRDLTADVTLTSSDPKIIRIKGTTVIPVGDGTAKIIAKIGEREATSEVVVRDLDSPPAVSFKNETLPALTKAGCNMGACHGSPSGKNGFRLSLRGFDPPLDILTLRTEYYGRRTNLMDPSESLILKKPLMEVAHGGGRRLHKGDACYHVLYDWISDGMPIDAAGTPDLVKIAVSPGQRVFHDGGKRQQLRVDGYFSDGSVQDLTGLTVFSSSNESVATVSADGFVEKTGRGETAILARLLDKMSTGSITFLEDVKGFAWTNPPVNNFVDTLVYDKLKQLQIVPSEPCSDEEFVRRAYLDADGRLPRPDETLAFLNSHDANRRGKLVDDLVDSADCAAFWTLKWCDVLRANSKKLEPAGVRKFRRWVYESVLADKPVDQMARELLTSQGSVFENPAANYWRASRDPQDATETTAQLFLGIRIQCAKCHNHPFERWSQDNYYGIAAAFARVGRRPGGNAKEEEVVFRENAGEIQQPRTGQTMKVHLLLKGDVDVPNDEDRRAVFAHWLTAPDNPFFARTCVNRIWGHLTGRGIVEPVDDFRDSNPPSNAKLLDELARQFVTHGYSSKWVMRTIMHSHVYELSARKNDFNKDDDLYFSHANTRMLTAEQLLDAICSVTNVPEHFTGLPVGTRAVELPDPPTDNYFLKIFGQPQREMACQCERSTDSNLSQALQMINGPVVHNKLRDDAGRIPQMIKTGKKNDEIIASLYLTALSRQPAAEEMAASRAHIARSSDRRQALEDIGWAILNCKEFLFQH
ncbi:MAG TPA: DUF1553 domain-containing protein [Planctomycetaceae bacterium]|nr:DUF1553 domain-containing protein [Planctomycetaceae bacterium]